MQQVETYKKKLDAALHEKNAATDVLVKIEQKTGVQRLFLVLGFAAFIALWLMVGYGAQFLANFIGFLYPAYCSIKAIETKETDDDTKWLTYWVVYAFFSLLEFFADIFLWWIPLYSFCKCCFLIYCMVPTSWNGSLIIYYKFIRPLVLRHQAKIDQALDKAGELAAEVFNMAKTSATEKVIESAEKELSDAAKNAAVNQVADSYKTE